MKKRDKVDNSIYENKIKRYKQRVAAIIAVICIIVLAVIFYFINQYMTDDFNSYKVLNKIDREDGNATQYISYDNKLLKYSRDGVSAIAPSGKVLWNASYNINNPKAVTCGGYVGVADIGGKQAYVIDSKGTTYTVTTTLPIIDVNLGSQGVIALNVEGEDYDQVLLYNATANSSTELVKMQTTVQSNGYPVDIAISKDAKKLVRSLVNIENGVLESDVGFFNFTSVGDNYEDQLVGVDKNEQTIAHDVVFLGNNTVLICTDKGFVLYEMEEIPSKLVKKDFDHEIQSMFYTDQYFGYIIKTEKEHSKGKLLLYNRKGKNILTKEINFDYKMVQMYGEDIVFTTESDIRILETSGRTKFKYKLKTPFVSLLPSTGKNEYILVTDYSIEHIKLVEEKR